MRIGKEYIKLLESIIGALEAGDPNLHGHSLFVRRLCRLLYNELPVNHRLFLNKSELECAALLIDIGRLRMPKEVVNKQGKFSREEKDVMNRQPGIAAEILKPVRSFRGIAKWIKYQHERVDGRGYYGLKADEIPFASKMLAVCDTYSAITMSRTYKAHYKYEDAMSELKLAAGFQLDEELVTLFSRIPLHEIKNASREVQNLMDYFSELKEKGTDGKKED